MRVYTRKKGGDLVQLTLQETDNSDRVSSRSVNYYHDTNSINTVIVTIQTNKFIFFCRPKWTSRHTDYWKLTNSVYQPDQT